MKTIDIQAKEWFDKTNGNRYFSGKVTVDFGLKTEKTFTMPFQYGYGSQYEYTAIELLVSNGYVNPDKTELSYRSLKNNGVIIRASKQENCKYRDVKKNL